MDASNDRSCTRTHPTFPPIRPIHHFHAQLPSSIVPNITYTCNLSLRPSITRSLIFHETIHACAGYELASLYDGHIFYSVSLPSMLYALHSRRQHVVFHLMEQRACCHKSRAVAEIALTNFVDWQGRFDLKRRWNILHAVQRCRQRQHQLFHAFFHPFARCLTTMALSFIGYVLFFSFLILLTLLLTTRTENLYRSSLILMFDTGGFSLVSIQLRRRFSFRMVRRDPALCYEGVPD